MLPEFKIIKLNWSIVNKVIKDEFFPQLFHSYGKLLLRFFF